MHSFCETVYNAFKVYFICCGIFPVAIVARWFGYPEPRDPYDPYNFSMLQESAIVGLYIAFAALLIWLPPWLGKQDEKRKKAEKRKAEEDAKARRQADAEKPYVTSFPTTGLGATRPSSDDDGFDEAICPSCGGKGSWSCGHSQCGNY